MATLWRKLSSHGNSTSETDGPIKSRQNPATSKKQLIDNDHLDMTPDKQLEEQVLCNCSEYLTNNLPADDIAPVMLTRNLLTAKEHDEYKIMKRSGRSTMTCMSEYLLECLRRRQGGFLRKFCEILREIEAAKYLGDYIKKSYHEATICGGFNTTSCDRLSKISLSDPDIRPKTPQGSMAISCTVCKELKRKNRKLLKHSSELKDQLSELEKDYQRLQYAKSKIEGQLEILQDQLQQEEAEKQRLKQIVPHLQQAMVLIETSCRTESATGTSGAQQTLNRISDLIHEQGKHDAFPIVIKRRYPRIHPSDISKRDSALSDTSSVTESSLADEDRNSDITSYPERNRLSTDFSKPVVSDLHRSMTQNQIKSKPNVMNINQNESTEQTSVAAMQETSSTDALRAQNQQYNPLESAKEMQRHTRSESDRITTASNIPHLNVHVRPRYNSESDVPSKRYQSQSFRHDRRGKHQPRDQPQNNSHTQIKELQSQRGADELSAILSKRREKLDQDSRSTTYQEAVTYRSQ